MKREARNIDLIGIGNHFQIRQRQRPSLPAPIATPARILSFREEGDMIDHRSPWLMPPPGSMSAAMQKDFTYQTDGERGILKERQRPSLTIATPSNASVIVPYNPCVPADVSAIVADPFTDPFNLGDTFTLSGFQVTGTTPITYEWKLNGVVVATTSTFDYTVQDADITAKDEFGLGILAFILKVSNACNTDGTTVAGTFNAQGTP